jgi:hypothetical protein
MIRVGSVQRTGHIISQNKLLVVNAKREKNCGMHASSLHTTERERERRSIACLVSVCMIGSPGWPRTAFLVGHRIADLGMAREAYIHII